MNTTSGATEMSAVGLTGRSCQVGTLCDGILHLSTLLFVICLALRVFKCVVPSHCSFFLEQL